MKRFRFFFVFILIIAVSGTAIPQISRDEQAVREVLTRELKGALAGNPDMIKSAYAPDYVGYMAWTDSVSVSQLITDGNTFVVHPEDWTIFVSTPQELDAYAENFRSAVKRYAEYFKKYPGSGHSNEIRRVTVKGDHAIAVTKHWTIVPNPGKQETMRWEMRTVWMIDKTKGEWKISRAISGVVRAQMIEKTYPQ